MNFPIFYIFKCGCHCDSFYKKEVNKSGMPCMRRFCPKCFDPALSDRAVKNKTCSLDCMESKCRKCGKRVKLSKNATTNTKLILCLKHKYLRNHINQKLRNARNKETQEHYKKPKERIAICPCCGKRHAVSAERLYSTQEPRIFCSACKHQKNTVYEYSDRAMI